MILYVEEYCIASVILSTVILYMYYSKPRFPSRHDRIFLLLLVDSILSAGVNVLTFYSISFPEKFPLSFNYLVNILYLFFRNLQATLAMLYVDSLVKVGRVKKYIYFVATAVTAYNIFFLSTSPVFHLGIYFDQQMVYCHGPLHVTLYVTAAMELIMSNILFLMKRKKFNAYQTISMSLLTLGNIVMFILQNAFPSYVLGDFVCSLTLLLVYFSFENHAFFLYGDTLCYNRHSFLKALQYRGETKKPYLVVGIRGENFEESASSMGRPGIESLNFRIAERLYYAFRGQAYCMNSNSFGVILDEEDLRVRDLEERIRKAFLEPFYLDASDQTKEVLLRPQIVKISVKAHFPKSYEMLELLQLPQTYEQRYIPDETIEMNLRGIRLEKKMLRMIDEALGENRFQIYYQPILDVHKGYFTNVEALLRLENGQGGFVNTEDLIRVAEKNGKINVIGSLVFEEVCSFISGHKNELLGLTHVEINLSPKQSSSEALSEELSRVLEHYQVDAGLINLEITETAEMGRGEIKLLHSTMMEMKKKGITFSLDDFGSGFAAIDYLIELPVELVKIDKTILWQAMKNAPSAAILRNTMRMIREVGKHVLVEGVETLEMAEFLRANGCDYMQGYYFARPMPGQSFLAFLQEHNGHILEGTLKEGVTCFQQGTSLTMEKERGA